MYYQGNPIKTTRRDYFTHIQMAKMKQRLFQARAWCGAAETSLPCWWDDKLLRSESPLAESVQAK